MSANSTSSITFESYATAALIFMARSNAHTILYVYSNGYLVPIKTDEMVIVSLSADYKTITVENNSEGTAFLGVLQGGSTGFELYVS